MRVLDGISVLIPASARIIGIIGPNGAGKTTLLEAIAGLTPISEGDIRWQGAPISPHKRKNILFYLPDGLLPDRDVTVGETLDFFRSQYLANERDFLQILQELNLNPLLSKKASQLSKGFRKKLLVTIAWLLPHPLVLFDEPFDGFDFKQTEQLIQSFHEKRDQGKRFILSIHQLKDAERVCDYFILLDNGRVLSSGALDDVLMLKDKRVSDLKEVFLALT